MISTAETTRQWAEQRALPLTFTIETGSTNDDAKAQAFSESADLVLYLTAHQTSGRGRGSNQWLDTGAGEGLLSTWSIRVDSPPQAITAPRIGLALFAASAKTWPSLSWGLKAPNDLYLDGLKAGGLLIESLTSGSAHRLLIGLGLNVSNHPRRFDTATDLTAPLGRVPDEGEWFRFLDEWRNQLSLAVVEVLQPTLNPTACEALKKALNANRARAFSVDKVSPEGDLHHAGGVVKWTTI
jgi:BirA family biotin operon repressor/biotin-[acetyl-CoA-carboxylase] ligase